MLDGARVVKSVDFLKSRCRVETRRVDKSGEGPLRFWDYRVAIRSPNHATGTGLVALEDIPAGSLVWTADLNQESSDILTLDEVLAFESAAKRQHWADYTWAITGLFFGPRRDLPVDDAITLEASHYLNHSCNANVGFATDTSLVAIRDIAKGEEISNDYSMTEFLVGFFPGFECGCGSDECRGQVTPNDWRRPELQKRYAGYFTSAVEALIKSVTTDFTPLMQTMPEAATELRQGIEVRPHSSPSLGKGLYATRAFAKGEALIVDRGYHRTISLHEVRQTTDPATQDFYARFGRQCGRAEFQVPPTMEEDQVPPSFFMNHSCDANAVAFGTLYVALRDIAAGEEITRDYATTETHFNRVAQCGCGSASCRGTVTRSDWKLPELQARYYPSSFAVHIIELMFGRFVET